LPSRHYPVRVRIEYSPRSSRTWALLTITLIKFLLLLPHALALFLLGLAAFFAFVAAQVVVLVRGVYPRPLFEFVAGVLRWQARVYAFALSLTDRYPPFSLEPLPDYPVDLEIVYPQRSSTWLASLSIAGLLLWLFVVLPLGWGAAGAVHSGSLPAIQPLDYLTNARLYGLLPHLLMLMFLFLATLVVFAVGQVMILIGASLPAGMHAFIAGWVRWMVRTWAWLYGLVDRYPPFTTEDTELGE
jgi:Domain of unknown function (DUF4389)